MLEEVTRLAELLAQQQARMDAAIGQTDDPALRRQLEEMAAAFHTNAAELIVHAETRGAQIEAAVAVYQAEHGTAPEMPSAPEPAVEQPAHDDQLSAYQRADWFGDFGHRVYPPETDS